MYKLYYCKVSSKSIQQLLRERVTNILTSIHPSIHPYIQTFTFIILVRIHIYSYVINIHAFTQVYFMLSLYIFCLPPGLKSFISKQDTLHNFFTNFYVYNISKEVRIYLTPTPGLLYFAMCIFIKQETTDKLSRRHRRLEKCATKLLSNANKSLATTRKPFFLMATGYV